MQSQHLQSQKNRGITVSSQTVAVVLQTLQRLRTNRQRRVASPPRVEAIPKACKVRGRKEARKMKGEGAGETRRDQGRVLGLGGVTACVVC